MRGRELLVGVEDAVEEGWFSAVRTDGRSAFGPDLHAVLSTQ